MKERASNETNEMVEKLRKQVVEIGYVTSPTAKKIKLNKADFWKKAQKVGRHLTDDSLSQPAPIRP